MKKTQNAVNMEAKTIKTKLKVDKLGQVYPPPKHQLFKGHRKVGKKTPVDKLIYQVNWEKLARV